MHLLLLLTALLLCCGMSFRAERTTRHRDQTSTTRWRRCCGNRSSACCCCCYYRGFCNRDHRGGGCQRCCGDECLKGRRAGEGRTAAPARRTGMIGPAWLLERLSRLPPTAARLFRACTYIQRRGTAKAGHRLPDLSSKGTLGHVVAVVICTPLHSQFVALHPVSKPLVYDVGTRVRCD